MRMSWIMAAIVAAMIIAPPESHYTTEGTAISSHEFITPDGNVWGVHDTLEVGREYTVEFADNATQNVRDDCVIRIKEEKHG